MLTPFLCVGITVLITHPKVAPFSRAVLLRIDGVIQLARRMVAHRP
jgi:hypothetical protein